MIKKVFAAVALFAMLTVAFVQAMEKEETPRQPDNLQGLQTGVKAPDFEIKTLTGETVKLSQFEGKKVMLNFWATWCPPCKEEMPEMEQFYREKKEEIVILAVNIDPQYDVQRFAKEMGVTFPILLDEDDSVNKKYQILTIPTTFFIDEKGMIRSKYLGSMTIDKMKQYLDDL
ncbi:ahpC/TSA family protein [Bacillus methanolicus PB1]|uniref:AhpC/TSA family protein n=1 Tax=Bacillus methanolicus PB1 TaxID=997296 RepID=I3DUR1_BACMT|nr:TlpA disulfide reductase family protein [Bacillus methanolicus]EIJ77982.1 ahpC/TSA family protein [Bacillus methanolicus PB1]